MCLIFNKKYIIILNLFFRNLNHELNLIYSKLFILDKELLIYYFMNILLNKSYSKILLNLLIFILIF